MRTIRVESKENDPEKCHIAYQISGSSFTMMHCDETSFPAGLNIILILPLFELFITGWNRDPTTFAVEERTLKFLSDTVEAINKDSEKN